jgi:phenylacetate-CoA ligase
MTPIKRRRRIAEMVGAARRARQLGRHDSWTHEQLVQHRDERLKTLVAHARAHSPFHRERLTSDSALPVMDKANLIDHYDEIVTDPRLRFAELEEHLQQLHSDELFEGHRVMGTGGTSGRRALFPYDAREWREVVAAFLRWGPLTGRRPRPGRRIAVVTTTSPRHMTARLAQTIDVGLMRVLRLDATTPLPRVVQALEHHRPQELHGYPSALALLAVEQLEGRLNIAPGFISTSSEVRTPEMTRLIEEAWGTSPFDVLGVTEAGIMAADCPAHAGLHVFEDQVKAEVIGDDDEAIPDGEPGRLVITPLGARTLPLLRYDTGDLVRATSEPCACGLPYMRLLEIQGRSDDILELAARTGGTVSVHPLVVRSPLASARGVAQYQVVCKIDAVQVALALRAGVDAEATRAAVREEVASALNAAGADVTVEVTVEHDLQSRRTGVGKHRLVVQA